MYFGNFVVVSKFILKSFQGVRGDGNVGLYRYAYFVRAVPVR